MSDEFFYIYNYIKANHPPLEGDRKGASASVNLNPQTFLACRNLESALAIVLEYLEIRC